MREYELTVIYDLAVMEAGGPDASVQQLTNLIETRGGKMVRVDHWGRRRMAYPIKRAIDGDFIVSRVELEPASVATIEDLLRIDERVYRHLVVRADELPVPAPPREARPATPAAAPAPAAATLPSSAEGATPDTTVPVAQPEGSLPAVEPVTAAEAIEQAAERPTAPEEVAPAAPEAAPMTEPLRDATPEESTTGFASSASEINSGISVEDLEEDKSTGPHTEQDSPTDETTL